MKALELINESTLGGGQTHVLDLARGLKARGNHDVTVGAAGGGPLEAAVRSAGIPFEPLPFDAGPFGKVGAIRALVERGRFDLVHTHGGVAGFWGRLAARGRAKLVHTLHGIHYLHYELAPMRWAYAGLDRWMAGWTDRVVCVCESDRQLALDAGVAVPERARVVLNGIDPEPFAAAPRAPHDGFVIGCVARLHRQKGLPFLLMAMVHVLTEVRDARLVLVGTGSEETWLRRAAGSLGLGDRVTFAGGVAAASAYPGFDVLALPSLWEGLPLALLEAMAAGLPVVASAVDGSREVIRDGVDGLLVPPGQPGLLAAALVRLAKDRELRARLAAAGPARVRAAFTLERMVRETEAIYDELR